MKVPASPCRVATLTLAGLLALTGCSSSSSTEPAASGGSAGLDAAQAFAALPPAEQEQELRAVTASMDRQLMTMSGLEAELGGAAQADAAYVARERGGEASSRRTLVDQPDFGRFGARIAAEDAPSIGGMMFGNFMIGGAGAGRCGGRANDRAPAPSRRRSRGPARPLPPGATGALTVSRATWPSRQLDVGGRVHRRWRHREAQDRHHRRAVSRSRRAQFTSTTTMTASVTIAGGGPVRTSRSTWRSRGRWTTMRKLVSV